MSWVVWLGRVLSGIVILFMAVDAVVHVMKIQPVVDAFTKLSLPINLSVPLGILVFILLALYLYAPTRILAAILLTGYLGGAIATHLRAQSTPFEIIFPVPIGSLLWLGLYLSDERVGRLILGMQ